MPMKPGTEAHDGLERRAFAGRVECRQVASNGAAPTLVGYAAVTERETVIDSGFFAWREKIARGAFKESIGRDDVRALFNHDPNVVLGRNRSNTLRLEEDATGLRYEVTTPDTQAARDVVTLVKRGDVSGSSFAFRIPDGGDEWDESGVKQGKLPLRIIRKVELFDVSPTVFPAYPTTSVTARNHAQAIHERTQPAWKGRLDLLRRRLAIEQADDAYLPRAAPTSRRVSAPAPDPACIIGYAATWEELAEGKDGVLQCYARGAFSDYTSGRRDVGLWFDHDRNQGLIASTLDGSLTLTEDAYGLRFEAKPKVTRALALAKRGQIVGISCSVHRERTDIVASRHLQTIRRARLAEISLCTSGTPLFRKPWAAIKDAGALRAIGRLQIDACRRRDNLK